jgi:N-acetylneuraminate synthase
MKADIFEDLFVLEMANNHLGKLERGLAIVSQFSKIIRFNNVRAAIKIQLRDVNTLIHADYRQRSDIRYIKKTLQTAMSTDDYTTLITAVRKAGAIPCATPFDESSVDLCVTLGVHIIKLASSD